MLYRASSTTGVFSIYCIDPVYVLPKTVANEHKYKQNKSRNFDSKSQLRSDAHKRESKDNITCEEYH
ncbi:uncharacterized protein PRCAT00004485001 [Priceomyces carsonii]|uniref:uncharacterized protein n=1 Tax=Priceomyces carsonii TaxID=28549 RepID=UPI002ED9F03A|nr:unnamed protein product [Priceomyces carsonii]